MALGVFLVSFLNQPNILLTYQLNLKGTLGCSLFKLHPSSLAVIKQTCNLFISKFLELVAVLLTLSGNRPVFLFGR